MYANNVFQINNLLTMFFTHIIIRYYYFLKMLENVHFYISLYLYC